MLKFLTNKFLIVTILLIVWLLYFDKNDFFTQLDLIHRCQKLNTEKEYYVTEIERNKKEIARSKLNCFGNGISMDVICSDKLNCLIA